MHDSFLGSTGFWLSIWPVIIGVILCTAASINVKASFSRYSKIYNSRGLTGGQAARQILDSNGLTYVSIEQIGGKLSDHFDPKANVIRLSQDVYNSTSVAAIGVAAHECGHAVQYAENYGPIVIRQYIQPAANIGAKMWYYIFLAGFIFLTSTLGTVLLYTSIALFALIVIFQIATLPVEFNASRRALETLEQFHILEGDELSGSAKVLRAAALTYVAAVASSLLQLLRILAIALLSAGRKRK